MCMRRPLALLKGLALLSLASSLAGCLAVDPASFETFLAATERLREGSDAVMRLQVEWTRMGFMDGAAENNASAETAFKQLTIQQDEKDPLKYWIEDAPLYIRLQESGKLFFDLNGVFVEYAVLLRKLAGNEVVDQAVFDRLARDLDSHLVDAAKAAQRAGYDVPEAGAGIAFLSTAAAESFRAYIESNRRAALKEALESAQTSVAKWSKLGDDVVRDVAEGLTTEYTRQRDQLGERFAEEREPEKRRAILAANAKLSDEFRTALDTLGGLAATYARLPDAHADLGKGVQSYDVTLDNLRAYYDHARHLYGLYEGLRKESNQALKESRR